MVKWRSDMAEIEQKEAAQLQKIIDKSKGFVFFGGAGVSTESGIPDFRSQDGLYNQKYHYPPETIISRSFYQNNKEEFYRFYKDKMIYPKALPNEAHKKLAQLENSGKCKAVVTQNIDGLHQLAGSKNVLELHGSVLRNFCQSCGKFFDVNYVIESKGIPICQCAGHIKPDVVLYEEGLDHRVMAKAIEAISKADLLIIGGTSLAVYPAAGLVEYFRGENIVLINREVTNNDAIAQYIFRENIGKLFEQIDS